MKEIKHITVCTVIVLVISTLIGMFSWKFLKKDNPLEQMAEKVIEAHTGMDIDFTD